jgi:hypothetical protein
MAFLNDIQRPEGASTLIKTPEELSKVNSLVTQNFIVFEIVFKELIS